MERHGYPRPQLQRDGWWLLNGTWQFAIDQSGCLTAPSQVQWERTILVPFSPETAESGIGDDGLYRACWYQRVIETPPLAPGERLRLHFGAVDHSATVWVNGAVVVRHTGGYTPFFADITDYLNDGPNQTVVVRAEDDPADLAKARGKQDWQRHPHSIWYPRTTGIWQTVWLERLPVVHIRALQWATNLERWEVGIEAEIAGLSDRLRLRVRLQAGDQVLADDTYGVIAGEVTRRIILSDPGIDDYRNTLLWSPTQPTLIDAEVWLLDDDGQVVDRVTSYTALRSVTTQGDRFLLNGRPYLLRLVLDQGYWPESGLTPPDDEALRRDVELAKAMGFNGVRKHQKLEDPRYLYWADRLGLLVWEEMPSAYRFTRRSVRELTREWTEAMERDRSHPCIVAWVPFNESWGVPDLPTVPDQQHYVQALYHLTKTLDPSRPIIGNDGWESVATDIIGIHDYDDNPDRISLRYESNDAIPHLFRRERPGGRLITLEGYPHAGQPIILSEFGGIAYTEEDEVSGWGYSRGRSISDLAEKFSNLMRVVRSLPLFAGFCYTQFADTYQEENGLLFADRRPKLPLEEIELAVRGHRRMPGTEQG